MASHARINLHETALSIAELEDGLRILQTGKADAFWEENVLAFRQTVLVAIQETSDALASAGVPLRCRAVLERQLKALRSYAQLTDEHIARTSRAMTIN